MGRKSMFSAAVGFVEEELQFGDDDTSPILLKNDAGTLKVEAIDGGGAGNFEVEGTTTLTGAVTMTTDVTSTGDVTGVNVTATTDVEATAGSVTAGTTVTGGTGVVATTGDIAASAGNVTASGNIAAVGNISGVDGTFTGDMTLSGRQINSRYTLREDFRTAVSVDLNGTVYTGVGGAVSSQQLVLTSDGAATADTFLCHAAKIDDTIDAANNEPYLKVKIQLDDVLTDGTCLFSVGLLDSTGDYFRLAFEKAVAGDTYFTVEGADGTLTATDVSTVTPANATDYIIEIGYNTIVGFYCSIDGTAIALTNLATLDHTQFTAGSMVISCNDGGAVLTGTVDKFVFDMVDVW